MTTEELPQPGVEVVQIFRATSPTVITPTLLSCVVGVCKQILEVYETDASGSSSLNEDALIQMPAFFEAPAGPYAGLDGTSLVISVNYGPNITIPFSDPLIVGLPAATIVSQVTSALTAAGVTSVTAELVGTDKWRLRTVGLGEFQRIYVDPTTDLAVQTAFSIGLGKTYIGLTGYNQYSVVVPEENFPDPNGNLDELSVESSSIRAFLYTGESTSIYEALRDTAFLRNGVVDDAAAITGATDITQATNPAWYAPLGTLDGTDFNIQFVDQTAVNITFIESAGHLVDELSLIARIVALEPNIQATIGTGVPGELILTSLVPGYAGSFTVSAGTVDALAILDPTSSLVGTHYGESIEAVDDGNSDAVTPILEFYGEDFTANPLLAPAQVTASAAFVSVTAGNTLIISDGGQEQTVVFSGLEATVAGGAPDLKTTIESVVGPIAGGKIVVTDGGGGELQLTHSDFGTDSAFHIIGGTALGELDPAVVTDAVGTVDIRQATNPLWYAPGGTLDGTDFYIQFAGQPAQQILFSEVGGDLVDETTLIAKIQTVVPDIQATIGVGVPGELVLHSLLPGATFTVSAGTGVDALALLDPLLAGTYVGTGPYVVVGDYRGTASKPEPGDELWIDGAYMGLVTQVAPGGVVTRLKIDTQLTISPAVGSYFYIIAKNLPSSTDPTRPDPQLTIDAYGNVVLKPEILRDVLGDPVVSTAPLYLTYTAIRLDVTARANNPGLLKLDNTTQIEEAIPPISTDNPLALGMYFASLNAPGSQITGLGVDEISSDAPYGTVDGFTRAAEYLEAFEVYGLAPLTHDETVGQVFSTHVTVMSDPEAKGERIALWNPSIPSYARDTLVASGTDGNSSGPTGLLFDTKVTNLTTLVIAQDIDPTGVIPASEGLYLDIASDSKRYSIAGISGSTVTIRIAFSPGENDDSYYSTTALNAAPLPSYLVQEQFSVKVRGAALVTASGDIDKDAIADNIQATGRVFQNRRFWMTVPDQAAANIEGIETLVEGFYMNAAIVGMIGQQPPQQSSAERTSSFRRPMVRRLSPAWRSPQTSQASRPVQTPSRRWWIWRPSSSGRGSRASLAGSTSRRASLTLLELF